MLFKCFSLLNHFSKFKQYLKLFSKLFHFSGIAMALLSQANHSIMSYGTFGTWGALLAGGQVLMPESHIVEATLQCIKSANMSNFVFI
jgi:hypothetical protein